jgi:predicted DNA-binding helix-hairpin-helix protein
MAGMDTEAKIDLLGEAAQFDICATSACLGVKAGGRKRDPGGLPRWIYPAIRPDGTKQLLMKVLMSNACRNDCAYCVNRCGGRGRAASFTAGELARTFLDFHRRGLAQGLFLSSAVEDDHTMSRMLDAVEILRGRAGFHGYIHLKVLPGATFGHVERAVELATRVSVNLEAPTPAHLARLAPDKNFGDGLLARMRWIHQCMNKKYEHVECKGQTTQYIVGATGESDREIVASAIGLYDELRLERAYFSAFQPLSGTPLEHLPPTPLMREHRLYQVDFLLRQYKWPREDVIFGADGNLSLRADPKYVWAVNHPECFPIEINTADLYQLLRIPGVGPRSARRIVRERNRGRLASLADLRSFGAAAKRAAPFVLMDGKQVVGEKGQRGLWEAGNEFTVASQADKL